MRPQDLEEPEHFRRWRQQKVGKIVQCGQKIEEEAIRKGASNFSPLFCIERFVSDVILGSED